MKKVKSVMYNWRQVGSTIDRDGAGDDWERFTVGDNGVNEPHNGMQLWNYVVELENGTTYRIFNPNFVVLPVLKWLITYGAMRSSGLLKRKLTYKNKNYVSRI